MTEYQINQAVKRNEWNSEHQALVVELLSTPMINNRKLEICKNLPYVDTHRIDVEEIATNLQEELACAVFKEWVKRHPAFDMAVGVFGGANMGKTSKGWKSTETLGLLLAANNITTVKLPFYATLNSLLG
jgi:hypothetical protein